MALATYLWGPVPVASQTRCSSEADAALRRGWEAYRSGTLPRAVENFQLAHRLCPSNTDAGVGLGYARLRLGETKQAAALFEGVLARDSTNSDAWDGKARSRLQLGDTAGAVSAGQRALSLAPNNTDLRSMLDRLAPDRDRPIAQPRRAASLQLVARTAGSRFEVLSAGKWQPFYIRGVNLGVALPGRYPSEFPPDSATYAGWLDTLAAMGANSLRVYTILPPAFYRALRGWNLTHPTKVLWLLHGVWAELPPRYDFQNPSWLSEFQSDMRSVVDLIHGSAILEPRLGHAAGRYDADVSSWVLGFIIGREWEPFAVKAFNTRRPTGSFQGQYLRVQRAPAMDLWLAEQCDRMLRYEAATYNALRPISYTSWPTLDPLHHATEATVAEEAAWRKRSGRKIEAPMLEYENDAVSIDPILITPTAQNPAGWFATYHAYPYYPDFMFLDPGYQKARSSEGVSSYYGYLRELIFHHRAIPTVIAEYGVPSSRGVAHLHPQGWSHGGHDERQMAAIDARLTREIQEAGAAGSIVFAWLDEWFKKNWAVAAYEIPADNTRLWHNVMNAEQNYGILGQYAGDRATTPRLGENPNQWRALSLIQESQSGPIRALRAGADESYWYIAVELAPGQFSWDSLALQLAIDTHRPAIGQHLIPDSRVRSEIGFEFLVELLNPRTASLRVIPEYNRHDVKLDPTTADDFGSFSRRPVITVNREDGRFDSLLVITNRARFGRDGTFYPARAYDRGSLRYGRQDSSSLSDWYLDEQAGVLQLRLAWDLINVTDPSSRTLLNDRHTTGPYGTSKVTGFHFGVIAREKRGSQGIAGALPATDHGVWLAKSFRQWIWNAWTEPKSHSQLKPVYDSLKQLWQAAPAGVPARPSRTAPSN